MKLVSYRGRDGRASLGVVVDGVIAKIAGHEDAIGLLCASEGMLAAQEVVASLEAGTTAKLDLLPLQGASLLPPVHRPTKVIGVGMNYHTFVAQVGEAIPAYPILFHKTSSSLTGSGSPIVIPRTTNQAVPEGELAVVIGRSGLCITESDVAKHVGGYTCANDVSARNLEFRTTQWTSGKMLETFCPLGPWIVTTDEIEHPDCLELRTLLNGKIIQSGHTSDMIFSVHRLVSEISSLVRLDVGDVILTGTPSDLGESTPPIFLSGGDVVTVEIERIGQLENPVYQS